MDNIGQSNFLQSLGWAVLNSLWQMALLWVVYQLIVGINRKTSPTQKSVLASSLLLAGFGWFVYTFVSIYISQLSGDAIAAAGFSDVESNQQLNDWMSRTLPLASLLYLVLLVFPIVHFIRNYRYVQVIRNYGLSKADVEWRMFVRKVAAQLGITKPVQIWVSSLVTSPVTIGYLKPVILVPLAAINHLSTRQMEAVLLHELAHIRRYDYFINLLIKFIQSILYFNPFVKAFVSIVEREREKSCDEMVIQFEYDPHGYATALLTLQQADNFPKPLAVAASGKKNDLLHRIEWIMGVREKKPVVSFNKLAGVMAGLLCIIGLNALVILGKPTLSGQTVTGSFATLASPLYFFTDDFTAAEAPMQLEETPNVILTEAKAVMPEKKIAKVKKPKVKVDMEALAEKVHYFTSNPYAAAVAYIDQPDIPQLSPAQEKQVKGAIDASKTLLAEGQWKAVEKDFAEVLTQQQKEELRTVYKKEMNKMDWKKWEQKLSQAYDKIDWDRINVELGKAVNNIHIDSIQRVYVNVLTNLNIVQNELTEMKVSCIPDSDVSLKSIEAKKKEVEKAINKLQSVRVKKTIHL
ncbi:MAG TPA: M56 family metallopeptidase [Chitinophagaceae bacterium]